MFDVTPDLLMIMLYFRLRIAFKWLVRAFSGYLASEQVLLLWDRILAYNSLDILAGKKKYMAIAVLRPYVLVLFWPSWCNFGDTVKIASAV